MSLCFTGLYRDSTIVWGSVWSWDSRSVSVFSSRLRLCARPVCVCRCVPAPTGVFEPVTDGLIKIAIAEFRHPARGGARSHMRPRALKLLAFVALPLAAASPACSAHSACALLLLAGNCCPNDWGGYLDCCEKYPPGMASPPTPAASPPPPPNPPPCASPPPSPTAASTSLLAPPPPPAAPVGGLLGGEPLGSTDLGKFKKAGPHPQRPSAIWGVDFEAPAPTNRWWINLVLADGETVGENAVDTLPYVIKALADGLHVCLPAKEATPNFVTLLFEDTLTFGARELVHTTRSIRSHGDLSVTVAWASGAMLADGSMVVPLVRGMPYASAIYTKMTPQLTFGTSPILNFNGQPPDAAKTVTAARLQFDLANGQTWVVYAKAPVDVTVDGPTVRFVKPYDGVLRAAIVTADTAGVLDAYASRVPTGCSVQATALGDRATLSFAFEAQGEGELLTMALPHHMEEGRLGGVARTKLSFSTLKGEMIGVVGDTWQVYEALPALEWGSPRPIAKEREDAVRAALAVDKEKVLGREAFPTPDPYGSGKEMAAAGRLALIADELGELATAAALRARLALKLEEWLSGTGALFATDDLPCMQALTKTPRPSRNSLEQGRTRSSTSPHTAASCRPTASSIAALTLAPAGTMTITSTTVTSCTQRRLWGARIRLGYMSGRPPSRT